MSSPPPRFPRPVPPPGVMIVDGDHELTLATYKNVLIAHWHGPHDTRNGKRLEAAMRQMGTDQAFAFIAIIEVDAPPPDKEERARIVRVLHELRIEALTTVTRGPPMRRSFVRMVLTAMLFLMHAELSGRVSFCSSEKECADWIANKLKGAPSADELLKVFESFQRS